MPRLRRDADPGVLVGQSADDRAKPCSGRRKQKASGRVVPLRAAAVAPIGAIVDAPDRDEAQHCPCARTDNGALAGSGFVASPELNLLDPGERYFPGIAVSRSDH